MNHFAVEDDTSIIPAGRVALGIEYMGAAYSGWQKQANADSVQAHIEKCLQSIIREPINVSCAGRTDAGVHATAQVVHFDSPVARPMKAYTRGMNTVLPKDIAITWARSVSSEFHARFSATSRRYRYVIYNNRLRSGVFNPGLTHVYLPLDINLMRESAKVLVGRHDFTSFRASHCQSKTATRTIHHLNLYQQQQYIIVDVKANAFLHHMVRNIVGALIDVGSGEESVGYIADVLALKDRTKASVTAKPNGLYLVEVEYDEHFGLGKTDLGPLFLKDLL